MNKIIIAMVIVAGLIGVFLLVSSPSDESTEISNSEQPYQQQSEKLTYESIEQELSSGTAFMYDVRTPEEYSAGYIKEASLFPLQDIQAGRYPEVPKDSTVYVYCRSGNRSAQAKSLLDKAGYTDVIDLGSYQDVENLGGTLVQ